jgi:transaldolase
VTLLFSLQRYREVAAAYIEGLEGALAKGLPLERVHSVASFFLSRIDTLVDSKLDERGGKAELRGKAAIAAAKVAYHTYQGIFAGDRFGKLREAGAEPQWLLWGSTSTKDPDYSDVKYVDALIGPETVNTVPEETFAAFLDHGDPKSRLTDDIQEAQRTLDRLAEAGIDMEAVGDQLLTEGVRKFVEPFDEMLKGLQKKIAA